MACKRKEIVLFLTLWALLALFKVDRLQIILVAKKYLRVATYVPFELLIRLLVQKNLIANPNFNFNSCKKDFGQVAINYTDRYNLVNNFNNKFMIVLWNK